MFLIGAVLFWAASGWIAGYPFPMGQGFDLMQACFVGSIPTKVNDLQKKLQNIDVFSQPDNNNQVRKLSILESQAWLYRGILERLGSDPLANHEKVAKTIEALEFKRHEFLRELEPRRPVNYRILSEIQDSARELLASQAEKDFEQLQKIFTNLVLFSRDRNPSQIILSEIIGKLSEEILESSNQISPYRLRLALRADELLRIISDKLIFNADNPISTSNYQSIINELRSRLSLLSNEFNNLLEENSDNKNKLFQRNSEIGTLTRNISSLSRELSNRDSDISKLRANVELYSENSRDFRKKENELKSRIQTLQNELKRERHKNQDIENDLESLKSRISIESKQKLNLQEKLELLSERLESQEVMISQLSEQVNSSSSEDKISEEAYQNISNKEDYEYVSGYSHYKTGKWVDAYYRRIPEHRRKKQT
jgi:DNA repair exonuclease SbcCD ATPase subunit